MDDINVKLAEMDAAIKEAETTGGRQERRINRVRKKRKGYTTSLWDPFDLDLQFYPHTIVLMDDYTIK